ncbi:MAG: T9SS type A sorting domain-containing protein, partial [Ignavibacteriaceae bacterium]
GQGIATIPGSYTAIFSRAFLNMQYNDIGGEPGGPIFGLSTYSLNFPQIPLSSDTSLSVTVTNFGITNTLTISDIVSSNSYFTITPNLTPINIPPSASQVFQVKNVSAATAQQGTIQFTHNAFGSPTNLNVSAPAGIQPGPVFEISPDPLIFIQQTAGYTDSLPVTITNEGLLNTLYIQNITSSNSYFAIYPDSLPLTIEPQSSLTLRVYYTSADTIQQGIIEFTHNAVGSPSSLTVSSVYSDAQILIYPSSILFGSLPGSADFWVTNPSNYEDLVINSATSSNSNYNFDQNSFPITVSPGSMGYFNITLENATGFQFTTIRIFNNVPGSPQILYASNQPLVPSIEGMITVASGPINRKMYFGLDTVATDGIDIILDEHDIPPVPPPGVFDARFVLPENNFSGYYNSWKDYRHESASFSGQKEYRLSYQKTDNYGIEISWDLPENITGVLQDIINGSFINVPIADTGSFIVQDPVIFNRLKMLIDFNGASPVELISFIATLLNYNVRLDWTTATEANNSGFEIYRKKSEDRIQESEWEKLGFVPGFGTTTEPKSYSFIDEDVKTGTYKYRLKQIDFDGTFEYSNEIEVEFDFIPKEFVLYQNYPNPFNPSTTIRFSIPQSSLVTLKIYNALGQEVRTLVNGFTESGLHTINFDASNLNSGVYFYKLDAGQFSEVKKITLIK